MNALRRVVRWLRRDRRWVYSYPRRHGKAGWKSTIDLSDYPIRIDPRIQGEEWYLEVRMWDEDLARNDD